MNKKRIDLKIESPELIEALETIKILTKSNTYACAIRDIIGAYPRLLSELKNMRNKLQITKAENDKLKIAISNYFDALETFKSFSKKEK